MLQWFDDRTGPIALQPYVFSVPMLAYRAAMLAWALWLAVSLLRWLRWGWLSFSEGGFWKSAPPRAKAGAAAFTPAPAAGTPSAPEGPSASSGPGDETPPAAPPPHGP